MAKKDKDCVVFVNTGCCSFGDLCQFRHPTKEHVEVDEEGNNGNASESEPVKSSPINTTRNMTFSDGMRMETMPCKFFQAGACNKGLFCSFHHATPAVPPEHPQLNSLGLPYRLGEQDCSYYMRNGSCGYGLACKYHHPDPNYYDFQPHEQWVTGDGFEYPHAPLMTYNTMQPTLSWNGNQGMASNYLNHDYYGIANYRHVQVSSLVLNEAGLPQRPGKSLCWHYERSGHCMYGSACAFDHPPKFSSNVDEGSSSKSASGDKTPETQE